jgi:hypothetical protein
LSRVPDLFVIARNSSSAYKARAVSVPRVAEDLSVKYVLEGSVRAAGNRVRVTAQLIEGASGRHMWSERYDGELSDIFQVQDDITRNIAVALQVKLTYGELGRLWKGRPSVCAPGRKWSRGASSSMNITRPTILAHAVCSRRIPSRSMAAHERWFPVGAKDTTSENASVPNP